MRTLNRICKQAVVTHHKGTPYRLRQRVVALCYGEGDDRGNLIVRRDNLKAGLETL